MKRKSRTVSDDCGYLVQGGILATNDDVDAHDPDLKLRLKRANSSLFSIATILDDNESGAFGGSCEEEDLVQVGCATTTSAKEDEGRAMSMTMTRAKSLPSVRLSLCASSVVRTASPAHTVTETETEEECDAPTSKSPTISRKKQNGATEAAAAKEDAFKIVQKLKSQQPSGTKSEIIRESRAEGWSSSNSSSSGGFYIDDDDDINDVNDKEDIVHSSASKEGSLICFKPQSPSLDDPSSTDALSNPRFPLEETHKTNISFKPEPMKQDNLCSGKPALPSEKRKLTSPFSCPDICTAVSVLSECTSTVKPKTLHKRTGLVFEAGQKHYDVRNRYHKERPARIIAVREHLAKKDVDILRQCVLISRADDGEEDSTEHLSANSRPVQIRTEANNSLGVEGLSQPQMDAKAFLDDEDFLRVHLPGYMKRLHTLSTSCMCNEDEKLEREAQQYKSIYLTKDTIQEAKKAASSLCALVSDVVTGVLDNGFAVIRPPGHHAEPSLAGGYCLINNVAVAASFSKEKLGVQRVLIVDWDVHHGNGTQDIFINDPSVLYFSVHRYHGGSYFPFLAKGGPSNVGIGAGVGYNMNVGWNQKGMGDAEYEAVWKTLLLPVAQEYNPDLVLVSAGFDAAEGDMGECVVTPSCFGRLTNQLQSLAGGKVVCTLEGGYVRSVLSRCVESVLRSLLGSCREITHGKHKNKNNKNNLGGGEREVNDDVDADERSGDDEKNPLDLIKTSAAKSVRSTIQAHREYWSCLREEECES